MQFRTIGLAVLLGGSASCALVMSYGDYEGASTSTGSSAGTGGGGGSTSTSSTSSGGAGPVCPDGGLPSIEICGNDVDEDCNGEVCKHVAQWARRYSDILVDGGDGDGDGGGDGGLDRQISAVAAGSTIHAFAGWHNGTLDLGDGFFQSNQTTPAGRKLFVAHVDTTGATKKLATVPDSPFPGEARGVAISSNGNVAVAAGFVDTGAVAGNDMVVVFSDTTVAINWKKQIGGSGLDQATAVTFDSGGNVLVAGFLSAGSGGLTCTQGNVTFNALSPQLLVASLDVKTGDCIWGKAFAAPAIFPSAMVLDPLGHLIVVGGFAGAIAGTTLVGPSWMSPFVLALNPTNGVTLWGQAFPTSAKESSALPSAVAAGNKGRLYLSGKFRGQVAFGATTLVSANPVEDEALLIALDGSNAGAGKVSWAHRFGGPNGFNRATGMVVVPQVDIDAIFMAGITAGKMSAVPDGAIGPLCPDGGLFLLKLHGESPVWGECFGTGGVDTTDVVHLANKGTRFMLAGARKSPIDFGNAVLAGQGKNDAFIAQFDSL